ncbi:MAG: hypothetical protein N4A49_11015 [Marinifilaceae bacterium]|jgi:hypothetical protein|nr:hypothetical protein [Marinifilaceae bacterium]
MEQISNQEESQQQIQQIGNNKFKANSLNFERAIEEEENTQQKLDSEKNHHNQIRSKLEKLIIFLNTNQNQTKQKISSDYTMQTKGLNKHQINTLNHIKSNEKEDENETNTIINNFILSIFDGFIINTMDQKEFKLSMDKFYFKYSNEGIKIAKVNENKNSGDLCTSSLILGNINLNNFLEKLILLKNIFLKKADLKKNDKTYPLILNIPYSHKEILDSKDENGIPLSLIFLVDTELIQKK